MIQRFCKSCTCTGHDWFVILVAQIVFGTPILCRYGLNLIDHTVCFIKTMATSLQKLQDEPILYAYALLQPEMHVLYRERDKTYETCFCETVFVRIGLIRKLKRMNSEFLLLLFFCFLIDCVQRLLCIFCSSTISPHLQMEFFSLLSTHSISPETNEWKKIFNTANENVLFVLPKWRKVYSQQEQQQHQQHKLIIC